jgi:hypothetical protein
MTDVHNVRHSLVFVVVQSRNQDCRLHVFELHETPHLHATWRHTIGWSAQLGLIQRLNVSEKRVFLNFGNKRIFVLETDQLLLIRGASEPLLDMESITFDLPANDFVHDIKELPSQGIAAVILGSCTVLKFDINKGELLNSQNKIKRQN